MILIRKLTICDVFSLVELGYPRLDPRCPADPIAGRFAALPVDEVLRPEAAEKKIAILPKMHTHHHRVVLLCGHRIG